MFAWRLPNAGAPGTQEGGVRAATLFSGIGAPEVAWPEWDWIWHAEIEKFPAAVMAARHPQSVNLGDVTADDFYDRAIAIGRPDVLVFGSPCQSYSVAGQRLGLDDPRGNLALVALGLVKRLRPTWFVFENVPGLFSSWSGEQDGIESSDFAAFLSGVQDSGYQCAWSVLDAQYFGVAQRRERVFVVGHADWRRAAAVLLEPESLCGHPPARGEARETAPTIPSRSSAGGGLGTDFDCDGGLIAFGGNRTSGPLDVATAVQAHGGPHGRQDFGSETFVVAHALRADGFDASEDGTGRGTPLVAFGFANTAGETNLGFTREQAAPITTRHADTGLVLSVNFRGRDGGTQAELGGEVATAVRAGGGTSSKSHVLASGVRRLTPVECERLQGFPDDYTNVTYRNKPAADGPRYKAIGNSMAVPVLRWILSRIDWLEKNLEASA